MDNSSSLIDSTGDRAPSSLAEAAQMFNVSYFLQIQDMAPLEVAVPIYGYLLPVVVMITVVTNSFIVLVLSQPSLRTPTNCILLAMAVTELLTGLVSLPWMLYYYTFGGHLTDAQIGMPAFWCRTSMYFAEILPTVFHTSAIWLTVYLAIQRYWFVCSTSHRRSLVPSANTISVERCRIVVAAICVAAMLVELPMIFGKYTMPVSIPPYTFCMIRMSDWVRRLGPNYFYSGYYWFLVIFVHAGPCTLLVIFGSLLIQTVHGAVRRRRESLGYLLRERDRSNSTSSCSSMTATTKMLVVVIIIFLITEIPAAVIFILHVLANTFQILPMDSYHSMNAALILRNVFILLSYPFNFCIYCSMSTQFRFTARRLFCRQMGFVFEGTTMNNNNTEMPRRSTNMIDGYLKSNESIIMQKRSSPLPMSSSSSRMKAAGVGGEARRFSLVDNTFLKPPPDGNHYQPPPRRKSNTPEMFITDQPPPPWTAEDANRNTDTDCFCMKKTTRVGGEEETKDEATENTEKTEEEIIDSTTSDTNGHCRRDSDWDESKKDEDTDHQL